ncbi:histidine kinase dimerization/phosphoacceptor domain -containing protein [Rhizobium sp. Root1220]|uniref:sensor histidine kinase n=1 Tax=Rhizobium sp. Root1220 TaxID=1736432 RepID=UPI000700D56A|nr:histidine kinase dimerization/phosphoacceptor domain -containing protein [Rhizobium sp. Root1220]KQV80519.1 histidine kinase [Rhizobium sp. Root1220]
MSEADASPMSPETVADLPHLAEVLDDDRFRQFLDHVPFGVAVAELAPSELIIYVNIEFERLMGASAEQLQGKPWSSLPLIHSVSGDQDLAIALLAGEEYLGSFATSADPEPQAMIDAWSNTIVDEAGVPIFRLVAIAIRNAGQTETDLASTLAEKDVLLRELQHRVKNNLQMITALIRIEARNAQYPDDGARFNRLAGRVDALTILYRSLSDTNAAETVDLGTYVSQIASAVMAAHAVQGIRLDMKVDTWPVSVNVAMPVGLVVNELMTNALKHAFKGREGGEIVLRCVADHTGCRISVSDDGVGLSNPTDWPRRGKLSAMIVQSIKQNTKAAVEVESTPGTGMKVTIVFEKQEAI